VRRLLATTFLILGFAPAVASPALASAATGAAARVETDATFTAAAPSSAPAGAGAIGGSSARSKTSPTTTQASSTENPIPVSPSEVAPVGRHLSADRVLEIAGRLPKMRRERAKNRGSYGGAYLKGPGRWQVSYFSRSGKEIGQVIIADADGRVLEQWTGFQVAWTMARGYPGAFGRHVNALYIWLPLCVLFLAPFVNWRRPFSLVHLDLGALLAFSVSLAFFNHGEIYASVPLVYPPLVYLLARMLALAFLRRGPARVPRSWISPRWLAVGVVFLLGFRIGLNVTDSNVIDVGYAGVIGAHRIAEGQPLYGSWPSDNEHGDTYGPVNYEAYVPFERVLGWSGTWDDLPAAHAASIVFDVLVVGLLFALGLRIRGPTLATALAYAWVSYPFTLYALESNSNDMLVAVLVLAALLCASSPPARGVFAAGASLTKFAPLALAPLLATHGLQELPHRRRPLALALFVGAFAATAAVVCIPALAHDTLREIYERTLVYQANRGSPFSLWGLYGEKSTWHSAQSVVEVGAVALALLLAVVPRARGIPALAAACAAILIALQLGVEHWFYLYIPWFFGLVMLALLGATARPRELPTAPAAQDAASGSARSSPLAVAASSG
jgi:hypothetical protein